MRRRLLLASSLLGMLPMRTARATTAAPGLDGIGAWLNVDAPVEIAALRGHPVLVNFWTYSCINALRTLPYLRRWHAEYAPAGLRILGIHTPEFGFEHERANVQDAVRALGIAYPVGQDNGYRTWRAWSNRAWPAFYIVDQDGRVVMLREGEGHSVEMERTIRGLLGLPAMMPRQPPEDADLSRLRSPELYFGASHPTPQEPAQMPRRGEASYAFGPSGPRLNRYELDGRWNREGEALILRSDRGGLRLRHGAAQVHLVAATMDAAPIRIRSDGGAWRSQVIDRPNLHTVVDGGGYADRLLEIEAPAGFTLYSATFG